MWHISTEDGLETETVYDLAFDAEGRAWMGTYGGLVSFEGIEAEMHYGHGLTTRSCTNLQFDKNGDIYYTNFANNLYRYSVDEDSSYEIKGNPLEGLSEFGDYYLNDQNEIWLTVSNLIFKGIIQNDSIAVSYERKGHTRSRIITDEHRTPWIVMQTGSKTRTLLNLETLDTFSFFGLGDYFIPLRVRDNQLWYSSDSFQNVSSIDIQKKKIHALFREKQDMVRINLCAFLDNQCWVGTTNGLFIADSNGDLVGGFSQPLFPGSTISEIKRDIEGNTWVASTNDGIWVLPNIKIIDINRSNPSFSHPISHAMPYGPKGWVVATENHKVYQLNEHIEVLKSFGTGERERITSMVVDADSNLLVGGFGGLKLLTFNEKKTESYKDFEQLPIGIRDFVMGPKSTLFLATWNGCIKYHFDHQSTKADPFSKAVQRPWFNSSIDVIGPNTIKSIFYDPHHKAMWQSMIGGPLIYYPGRKEPKRLIHADGRIKESIINDYEIDDQGRLWLGTAGSCLMVVDSHNIQQVFTPKDGLKSPVILDMARYENELWLATYEGIQLFDLETHQFKEFRNYQGIKELPYNTIAVNEKYVIAGHPKSSIVFNKNDVEKESIPPPIFIKKVYVNGNDTILKKKYDLSYDQENLRVWFSTIHYSSAKSFDFEYRITEQGNEWQSVPGEFGRVDLNGLRPGSYTFEVRAVNSAGVRSDTSAQIVFVINPAFWQTLTFQLSIVFFFGLLISSVALIRIRTIKKQARLLAENASIDAEKQQLETDLKQAQLSALKAQLNPHFMFNALNSIQEFILLNERTQANRFLGKFADLMRLTLDNSSKKHISLSDEITLLDLYLQLEGLRFEEQFSYEIRKDLNANLDNIQIPAMLIQPYVENALKHGLLHKKEDRKVLVSFELSDDVLTVVIEDNGVGRENSQKINKMRKTGHQSFAMGANEKRLNLLNTGKTQNIAVEIEDLYNDRRQPTGTRVTLSIPVI